MRPAGVHVGLQQLARVEPLGLEMLADALVERHEVAGLVVNRPGGQVTTPTRPHLRNLDGLPRLARELTAPWRRHYHAALAHWLASVESARGCPYRCNF